MLPGELDGQRVLRALTRLGWAVVSTKGSHRKLIGPDGSRLILAFHGSISRSAVLRCLRQAAIPRTEFEREY